ncbi:hypothetical protein D9Q98_001301 [Chlorella vulgaris]|uniref:Pseudouridine synthase RsuA/RluA-like domain-containing protein n=1 Tax=Chlorella vulgaris TaxID=3077 RepID=A0A9D4U1G8_CHLVU|nr:hypothetical protein D9Q98_001301 [Chlorella vulgaris]
MGEAKQAMLALAEASDTPIKPEDYLVVEGHRVVKPYHYDFCCNVRQRWLGRSIIDIFSKEFPARDRQHYVQALADGRLRVEGCEVAADTPLRDGQCMRHFIHRHEPPVPAGSITVIGQSEDAVAVCKPHGMPVHVGGQYRKNTVLGILTAERPDLGPLLPIHRLDKPVSGVLLFARNAAAAAALCAKIEGREVEKVYVARVLGRFPSSEGPVVADVPLAWDPSTNHVTAEPGQAGSAAAAVAGADVQAEAAAGADTLAAAASVDRHSPGAAGAAPVQEQQQQQQDQTAEGEGPQAGAASDRTQRKLLKKAYKQQRKQAKAERVAAVAAATAAAAASKSSKRAAKPALTEFRLLEVAADGLTSLVECRPRTGRTHQIRVHLQYLGHPIANDTQYGGTYGGPLAMRTMAEHLGVQWAAAETEDEVDEGSSGTGSSKRPRLDASAAGGDAAPVQERLPAAAAGAEQSVGDAAAYAQSLAFRSQPQFQVAAELCDAHCSNCPYYAPADYPVDLRPIWLHARTYSCQQDGWSFTAELPEWAAAGWTPPA